MFLVMGITGKVGGATAEHLLAPIDESATTRGGAALVSASTQFAITPFASL